jgi:hypothetical protein
MVTPKVLLTPE